jgi:hypothetical protein
MTSQGQTGKRKAPLDSSTKHEVGTIDFGLDGNLWVVTQTERGVKRWSPYISAVLFGFRPLTTKVLAQHIGVPITVYERQDGGDWPTKRSDFDVKYTFIASGDVLLNGKALSGFWAKKLKKKDMCIIQGTLKSKDYSGTIHTGPSGLISSNLMNTQAFVRT